MPTSSGLPVPTAPAPALRGSVNAARIAAMSNVLFMSRCLGASVCRDQWTRALRTTGNRAPLRIVWLPLEVAAGDERLRQVCRILDGCRDHEPVARVGMREAR